MSSVLVDGVMEEGVDNVDANTKYFHGIMSSRGRGNAMSSILVDAVMVEDVDNVCCVMFSHFSSHFKSRSIYEPHVEAIVSFFVT